MAVHEWIDEVCKLAGEVTVGSKQIKSYSCFSKDNFPESMSEFPCAISYVKDAVVQYSDAGPHLVIWEGVTEFHIDGTVNKQLMPDAMRMYLSVMKAFAAHRTLGGKVLFCQLRTDEKSILGPLELKYGSETGHLGLIAQWVVKEDIAGELTLGS